MAQNVTPIADQTLSAKLRTVRSQFLHAVETGGARQWTVVMGNESGDLDTIASSLALWWFRRDVLKNEKTVPLIQTPRGEMKLRPENELALSLVSLDAAHEDLLCIDDLQPSKPFPTNKFVLVDHNRLLSRFSDGNPETSVVAIVDHHEDEQLHLEANPRIIRTPVGSASSLVIDYIKDNLPSRIVVPSDISSLLLSAILIDTGGLKPGGKAEDVDRASAASLLPISLFAQSVNFVIPGPDSGVRTMSPDALHEHPVMQSLFEDLMERKSNVLHLDATDLLKRDYKQYEWNFRHVDDRTRRVTVGLSTVPLNLQSWLPRSGSSNFFDTVLDYMEGQGLDILGVLTSFHKGKSSKHHDGDVHEKKDTGKHKRQLMLIFRSSEDHSTQSPELVQHVLSSLMTIDAAKILELEEVKAMKYFEKSDSSPTQWSPGSSKSAVVITNGQRMDVYRFKQKNAKATRKIIAPLLKEIIEGQGISML